MPWILFMRKIMLGVLFVFFLYLTSFICLLWSSPLSQVALFLQFYGYIILHVQCLYANIVFSSLILNDTLVISIGWPLQIGLQWTEKCRHFLKYRFNFVGLYMLESLYNFFEVFTISSIVCTQVLACISMPWQAYGSQRRAGVHSRFPQLVLGIQIWLSAHVKSPSSLWDIY